MRLDAVLVLVLAASAAATSPTPVPARAFAGTWKGRILDQPAVDLRLKAEGASVSGVAVFYKIDPGAASPAEKVEVPLRDVRLEKGVLSFGVRRVEDGGITRMQMKVVRSGEAELKTLAEGLDATRAPEGGEPALTLKRE
jgi:hypothetical protein